VDKYETLMGFILELDEQTLHFIKAAASKRFASIARMVERNPLAPTSGVESVVEDFLNRVDDYLPPAGTTPAAPDQLPCADCEDEELCGGHPFAAGCSKAAGG
jgi:hypothetical protein